MPGHLDSIVALQSTLDQLDHANQRLHGIPDWMQELHEEHSGRLSQIQAMESEIEEAERERRASEGEIEDAQEKLKRYQQQINAVSTQREYGALLQEIDTVKRQIADGEERGLGALDRIEQLQRELAAEREAFRELDERYAAELAKWEAQKPGVAAQVAELEQQVESLRSALPRHVLSQLDRLIGRLGSALAPIRKVERSGRSASMWHCGACNYVVRPQVLVEIRNSGRLIQCESCKRILYLEEQA